MENSSHEYFISILEQAVDLLKPNFEQQKRSKLAKTSVVDASSASKPTYLINRFNLLEVEDINDDVMNDLASSAADVVAATANSQSEPGKKNKTKPMEIVELEADDRGELVVIMYWLYEDRYRYREYIRDMWKNVAISKVGYLVASVSTEYAQGLVAGKEKMITDTYPDILRNSSYRVLTLLFWEVSIPDLSAPGFEGLSIAVGSESEAHHKPRETGVLTSDYAVPPDLVFFETYISLEKNKYCINTLDNEPSVV